VGRQRFLIVGEGPQDIGRKAHPAANDAVDYQGAVAELTLSCLHEAGGIPREAIQLDTSTIRNLRLHAGGWTRKVSAWMTQAQQDSYDALFIVIDRDGDKTRIQEMRLGRERSEETIPTALGCAVETLEAWLLGDGEQLCECLGIRRDDIPSRPESLDGPPGSKSHPKTFLHSLLAHIEAKGIIYQEIAKRTRIGILCRTCPEGFGMYKKEIDLVLKSLHPTIS